jgi:HAD superfamily hydrolase (TIGR01509 family)
LGRTPLTEEELRYGHTHPVRDGIRHLFRHSPEKARQALEIFSRMDPGESAARLKPEPGLLPTLQSLKERGLLLAISTSRTTNMDHILERFALKPFFDLVVTSRDVAHPKPHPESVEKILRAFDLEKEEVLLVGDSETDRETALAAGIRFVAYKNRGMPADAYLDDHPGILDLV